MIYFDERKYEDFKLKWLGETCDFDGRYGGQCVDLFRMYNKEVLGIKTQPRGVVGAKDFWDNFESDKNLYQNFKKIKNTPTLKFKKGDIVIWSGQYGTYGHIAICDEDSGIWNFNAFSQNDPANSKCAVKTYKFKYVYGVLRPRTYIKSPAEIILHDGVISEKGKLYGFKK